MMGGDGHGRGRGSGLLPLLELRVLPSTLERYQTGVHLFLSWTTASSMFLADADALDHALAIYAHSGKVTRSAFELLVCAVRFFLPALVSLPYAGASLRGWRKHTAPRHKTPMLFICVVAFARALCRRDAHEQAAGLVVQFGAFLRPNELLRLTAKDVVLPEAAPQYGPTPTAILVLGTATRGTKVGRQQVAHVRHPWAIAALRFLVHRARVHGGTLVRVPYSQYRASFLRAGEDTGLTQAGLRFTPHCPRAGAATQGKLEGRSVPDLMEDGRWVAQRSLRTYLDVAMAMASRSLHAAQPFRALLEQPASVGPIFIF